MLVLTRRVGEKIVIGNEIVVEILSVSGDGVRLGIVAPRETSVHRHEVFVEIQNANRLASDASAAVSNESLKNMVAHLGKPPEPADHDDEQR